ncbi:MAG: asparagine synthase (glutamine-hydrolyzing) [Phycisphaerae bacterium]
MCGICGICNVDPKQPVDVSVLAEMTETLRHRGPDGEGVFVGGGVGLGHRRLAIIDLVSGDQPMYNRDRSVVIVFNGEIYNYLELKDQLSAIGHAFVTSSDTEVILRCYEAMGPECVNALNGMFAFAIWDERSRTLLLARDRLGEKPLYYFSTGERLLFASELKALLKHPAVEAKVSLSALDDYLAYGYVPADQCILDGVCKLPSGCTLLWRDGRIQVQRYWDVRFDESQISDESAWSEELEHRLRESIRIRLRSDVPLGVFLSGGVDSSAVTALASHETSGRLKTFSVGFDETDFNELKYARTVAQRYDTDHVEIMVRDCDLSILPDLVYHLDEPFADPSALPTYYVCREARRQVTVCLSGDGGDEIFAGYPRYRQALRHQRWARVTPAAAKRLARAASSVVPRHFRGRGMLERCGTDGAEQYALQVGLFDTDERRELFRDDVKSQVRRSGDLFAPYFERGTGKSLVTVLQHVDQKTYLPDDILFKVDRMSMQNSLEVRLPLLDHTLVEYVNHVSPHWKLRNGVSKYVFRKILEPHLPPELLRRRKMGFGIPIKYWFRGGQDHFFRERLLSPDARCTQWLSREAIERILQDHLRGGRDLSAKLWTLLILEVWCRNFDV